MITKDLTPGGCVITKDLTPGGCDPRWLTPGGQVDMTPGGQVDRWTTGGLTPGGRVTPGGRGGEARLWLAEQSAYDVWQAKQRFQAVPMHVQAAPAAA